MSDIWFEMLVYKPNNGFLVHLNALLCYVNTQGQIEDSEIWMGKDM
jgi:hypothetical protein